MNLSDRPIDSLKRLFQRCISTIWRCLESHGPHSLLNVGILPTCRTRRGPEHLLLQEERAAIVSSVRAETAARKKPPVVSWLARDSRGRRAIDSRTGGARGNRARQFFGGARHLDEEIPRRLLRLHLC